MYKIEYSQGYWSRSTPVEWIIFEKKLSARSPKEASDKLLSLSFSRPISYMRLGESQPLKVKKRHESVPAFARWSLDYSQEELAELIRKALPKGGQINVWHDPMMGLP